jgi:hypothetical protein
METIRYSDQVNQADWPPEHVQYAGGSVKRRRDVRQFLDGWRRDGFHSHYRQDQDGNRIIDTEARRQQLEDRQHPIRATLRRLKGELEYRRRLRRLQEL